MLFMYALLKLMEMPIFSFLIKSVLYYLRNGLQPLFVVSKVTAVDVGSYSGCIFLAALVVAT